MNKLENLKWVPRWVSYLGCVKGCLDYLGLDISDAWLFGATGHAFVINVHKEICPSGPTAWNTEMLFKLGKNIGYEIDGVFGMKSANDADGFAKKQKQAWEHVKRAIGQGVPCMGWELDIPEFYVIYGYKDGGGYFFSGPGCDEGKGPKPWQELGDTEIGCIEVSSIKPGQAADDAQSVKEALTFALEHATSPEKWIFPDYKAGLAGYGNWIRALEDSSTDGGIGMAYNAAVWSECRGYAVGFLREAKERLGGQAATLFDEAIGQYQVIAKHLETVTEVFPFHGLEPGHIKDKTRVRTAIEALRVARDTEADGLKTLQEIVKEL